MVCLSSFLCFQGIEMIESTITPSQFEQILDFELKTVKQGVLYVHGQPGIAKSEIIRQVAEKHNLYVITLNLSNMETIDIAGIPSIDWEKETAKWIPFSVFPRYSDSMPFKYRETHNPDGSVSIQPTDERYKGIVLFLDEFNSASRSVQAAACALILDKRMGNEKLNPNVRIVCAGNNITDGAVANSMPTQMQSRLKHLNMVFSFTDFLAHIKKTENNWAEEIISFFSSGIGVEYANTFNPDMATEVKTYAVPRTWRFLSDEINDSENSYIGAVFSALREGKYQEKITIGERSMNFFDAWLLAGSYIKGIVGEKAGAEFVTYAYRYTEIPSIQDIIEKPDETPLPVNTDARWLLPQMIAKNIEQIYGKNFINDQKVIDNLFKYLDKIEHYESELLLYTYNSLSKINKRFMTIKEFRKRFDKLNGNESRI